jgi:hypothetical protein
MEAVSTEALIGDARRVLMVRSTTSRPAPTSRRYA